MSDDDREHLTELHTLVGSEKKRRGCCCVTHPVCCTCTLGVVVTFCLAVVILGAVFHNRVDKAVLDAIGKVSVKKAGIQWSVRGVTCMASSQSGDFFYLGWLQCSELAVCAITNILFACWLLLIEAAV